MKLFKGCLIALPISLLLWAGIVVLVLWAVKWASPGSHSSSGLEGSPLCGRYYFFLRQHDWLTKVCGKCMPHSPCFPQQSPSMRSKTSHRARLCRRAGDVCLQCLCGIQFADYAVV